MTMGEEKKIEVEEVDGVDTPPRARVDARNSSASATISPASSPRRSPSPKRAAPAASFRKR